MVNRRVSRLVGAEKLQSLGEGGAGGGGGGDGGGGYHNIDDDDCREQAIRRAELAALEMDDTQGKKVGFLALFSFSTVGERWWMLLGTLFAGISGLAMPTWLLLLAQSLETFNNIGKIIAAGGDISILKDEMDRLIHSFAIVGAITFISGTCYVAMFTYTGERQTLRVRQKFVHSALRQEASWFDRKGDAQEVPIMASNALTRINKAIGREVGDTFANLLSGVGSICVALGLNAQLALFMICMLPIIAVAIGIISCYMRKSSGAALASFGAAGAFATEVITGIKTVSSLCAEKWALSTYEAYAREAQKHSIHSQFLSKLTAGVMGFLFYGTYTFAFIFGTEQVAQRADKENENWTPFSCMFIEDCGISGSEVMVCIYAVMLSCQFFAMLSPSLSAIDLGRAAAAEIYGAIHRQPDIDGTNEDRGIKLEGEGELKFDGSIEFQKVAFCYPTRPRDLIFTSFSLKIEAGSAVALVGPSGSGKSTLSKLVLRMYDPVAGKVKASGVPLTELNIKWWRSKIGYVAQEPSLFPGTIRDNIAAGKIGQDGKEVTDEEVIEASKAASAHEFIMELPDGYNTFYSGSSIQMSGGQIQRIAIARALIRNPSILLLDEATSALDTQSERSVQDALAKIRSTRKVTTITVAHRLSTIVHSDQIAVVADGFIQELGTHKELVEEGGIYAALCEGQGLTVNAADLLVDSTIAEETEQAIERAVPFSEVDGTKTLATGDVVDVEAGLGKKEENEHVSLLDTSGVTSRLWEYNKDERWYMLLGYFGATLVGALAPSEAILFGTITASYFTIDDGDELRKNTMPLCFWFLLMAGVSLLANMAMGTGFGVSGFRLSRRMRVLVFEKMTRHSMGWFDFAEHSAGELSTRLEEDSEAVSNLTGWQQGQRVQVCSSVMVGVVIAMSYSWEIGLLAIACVPFIVGSSLLQARCAARKPAYDHDKYFVSAPTLLERAFSDIMVVQAYGLQDYVSTKYSDALAPDAEFKKKMGLYNGLGFGFSQFSTFATFALIFYAGIQFMIEEMIGFTDFFVALLAVMFSAFAAGSAQLSSRHEGLQAAARIFKIVDEPLDGDDPFQSKGNKPERLEGAVNFKACHFAYPTRQEAPVYYAKDGRDGFSLDIHSKQSVAFTGRSGCGKSTALQLLMRFYRVNSGSVNLDSENIEELNLNWLRENIGYVGQMPVLFHGTIKENILLGKPDATDEEIIQAAKSANAHGFISGMNKGYDTDIGVGGSLLSGGQKQRVAIARAIVKDPKILVLDEATSALDNESEKIVQAALDTMQESQPRTTLMVAHRLETVKKCDKIVVLDRGGVKEQGSHTELLQSKGLYHTLWTKQGGKED